ncbi:MAG: hypothetical protein AAGI30_14305 [Planctomycetota bacterium]
MGLIAAKIRNLAVGVTGGLSALAHPRLSEIYGNAARQDSSTRNPLVVIPGIMGTRLEDPGSGLIVWGSHRKKDYPDRTNAEHMRIASHNMRSGVPLHLLTDSVEPAGAIEQFKFRLVGLPFHVQAYAAILTTLGVGGFAMRDEGRKRKKQRRLSLDYDAASIATCFQFDYDWRRSIPENAGRLMRFVDKVREFAAYDSTARGEPKNADDIRVDFVAHSMGGLLLRYFLRYGGQLLPQDGSLPKLTWSGATRADHAVLIGTPNAGSHFALDKLIRGLPASPAMPGYGGELLGTYPTLFQLMPRDRHTPFVDRASGEPVSGLYDIETWQRMRWGLASAEADPFLEMVLPDDSPSDRRRIAIDHLDKCLREADRFHRSLDEPVDAPYDVAMHLFAGDGVLTPACAEVEADSKHYRVIQTAHGDGTVLRTSALMDERVGQPWKPRVKTPIRWDQVTFIPTGHMSLTRHPTFVNNVLYTLLEKPAPDCNYRHRFDGQFVAPRHGAQAAPAANTPCTDEQPAQTNGSPVVRSVGTDARQPVGTSAP